MGSGEGQKRFLAHAVDFGASDAALSDEQLAAVKPGARLVPVTAGMVVLAYNLPGLGGDLRLSRAVCADIFAGTIKTWDDPRIRADNPGLTLPRRSIALIVRQDWQRDHLRPVGAPERGERELARPRPGVGTLLELAGQYHAGAGQRGGGRTDQGQRGLDRLRGVHFAKRLGLPMAQLQNRAGRFIAPSETSGQTALARNATQMPANLRLFLPDPEGEDAYPIVSFSWLLLYERYEDRDKVTALKKFVAWGLTEGQTLSRELGYIPLPEAVAALSLAALEQIH